MSGGEEEERGLPLPTFLFSSHHLKLYIFYFYRKERESVACVQQQEQ
jgi:hypothetical protein